MKEITIGSVGIPLDSYVVGGTALLGIRESGKTYAAKGIAGAIAGVQDSDSCICIRLESGAT